MHLFSIPVAVISILTIIWALENPALTSILTEFINADNW